MLSLESLKRRFALLGCVALTAACAPMSTTEITTETSKPTNASSATSVSGGTTSAVPRTSVAIAPSADATDRSDSERKLDTVLARLERMESRMGAVGAPSTLTSSASSAGGDSNQELMRKMDTTLARLERIENRTTTLQAQIGKTSQGGSLADRASELATRADNTSTRLDRIEQSLGRAATTASSVAEAAAASSSKSDQVLVRLDQLEQKIGGLASKAEGNAKDSTLIERSSELTHKVDLMSARLDKIETRLAPTTPRFKETIELTFPETGRTTLSDDQMVKLAPLRKYRDQPATHYSIVGFADGRTGSTTTNLNISRARAESVARWLVLETNTPSGHISFVGAGETDKFGEDPRGNRRVIVRAHDE